MGFTFIEVLCMVLILTVGLLSAVILMRYGMRMAKQAQSAALAYPTARSILIDAKPYGVAAIDWGPDGSGGWQGYINNLWVRRTIVPGSSTTIAGMTYATVRVEVFWSDSSDRVLSLQERVSFHDAP